MDTKLKVNYFLVMRNKIAIDDVNRGLELRGLDASTVISIVKDGDCWVVFYRC